MSITTKEINYQVNGESFTGYLAFDDSISEPKPGVLIVHEWWGHNDYVRKRAEQIAGDGLVAFAVDMYGTGKLATNPEQAGEYMNAVVGTEGALEQRFDAAYQVLSEQAQVESSKINIAGYCFGGMVGLNMARAGKKLHAVASFHGLLETSTPMQADTFGGEIAIFNGADDPMVTPEIVKTFENEMDSAGVACSMTNYPGVVHGFTNPEATAKGEKYGMPLRYDADADRDSYTSMIELFSE